MPIGNHVILNDLTVGGFNLLDTNVGQYTSIEYFNTLFDPFPKINIGTLDYKNNILPNLKNDQPITINIGMENGGDSLNYTFMPQKEVNVNDRSMSKQTAMKSKMFDVAGIDEGYLNMKAFGHISKSYDTQVSKMMEDFVKNVLKSNASFEAEETKGNQRFIARGNPAKVFGHYLSRSVSPNNKGSAYVLYRPDYNTYKYESIEKMITQGPVATYQQRTTLAGASEQERLHSIQYIKVYGSNKNDWSHLKGTQQRSYDPDTGKATWPKTSPSEFKVAGQPQDTGLDPRIERVNHYNREYERTQHSRNNTKSATDIMRNRADRAAYLNTLSKNYAEIAVPFNTVLKPGSMINLEIPVKASDASGNEKFSGPCLILNVNHKLLPGGRGVSYVRVTKGGGQEQSGA